MYQKLPSVHRKTAPSLDTIRNRLIEAGRDLYGGVGEERNLSAETSAASA